MASLSRNIGEFFGHIIKAVRSDPSKATSETHVVSEEVEEERRGNVTLRRTTIEEVEIEKSD